MYDFLLECLVCKAQKIITTRSPHMDIRKILDSTNWVRASLLLSGNLKASGWICAKCAKERKLMEKAKDKTIL